MRTQTRPSLRLAAISALEQICWLVQGLVNQFTRRTTSDFPTPHRDDAAKEVDGDPGTAPPGDRCRRTVRIQWRLLFAGQSARSAHQLSASQTRGRGEGRWARHELPLLP